jgi:hypothetical protein
MDATTVLGADPASGQPPRPRVGPPGSGSADRGPAGSGGASAGPAIERLPRARAVDRDEYLLGAAAGRTVTHVGFAGPGPRPGGRWLHARLADVAASVVGVDREPVAVAAAHAAGYEAHHVDCADPGAVSRAGIRPAQLLLVADVLEQVDDVGALLEGLRRLVAPDGVMIMTTANACRLLNVLHALGGRELAQPDQVAWYSWRTLLNVLERHSWWVVGFNTYQAPSWRGGGITGLAVAAERAAARLVAPFLAYGLIAVCRPGYPSPAEPAAEEASARLGGRPAPAVAPLPAVGQRQP